MTTMNVSSGGDFCGEGVGDGRDEKPVKITRLSVKGDHDLNRSNLYFYFSGIEVI